MAGSDERWPGRNSGVESKGGGTDAQQHLHTLTPFPLSSYQSATGAAWGTVAPTPVYFFQCLTNLFSVLPCQKCHVRETWFALITLSMLSPEGRVSV